MIQYTALRIPLPEILLSQEEMNFYLFLSFLLSLQFQGQQTYITNVPELILLFQHLPNNVLIAHLLNVIAILHLTCYQNWIVHCGQFFIKQTLSYICHCDHHILGLQ